MRILIMCVAVPPPKLSRTSEKPSKESDRLQDDDTRGRKLDREEANGDNRAYRKPAVIASSSKLPRPKNIKVELVLGYTV